MVRSALSPCNAMAHHSVARRATQRRKSARRMGKSSLKHFIRHKARWMLEQAGRQLPELEVVCDRSPLQPDAHPEAASSVPWSPGL